MHSSGLYNNNPTNKENEITWLFQNSVKFGTNLDKKVQL